MISPGDRVVCIKETVWVKEGSEGILQYIDHSDNITRQVVGDCYIHWDLLSGVRADQPLWIHRECIRLVDDGKDFEVSFEI